MCVTKVKVSVFCPGIYVIFLGLYLWFKHILFRRIGLGVCIKRDIIFPMDWLAQNGVATVDPPVDHCWLARLCGFKALQGFYT